MSFFDSDMVKEDMKSISEIQRQIVKELPAFFAMTTAEKLAHIDLLEKLLEKQEIIYTRLCLSDDPEALQMKQQMRDSAQLLGFGDTPDIHEVFKTMKATVEGLRKTAIRDR
jgi:hypothetical protein